MTDWPKRIGFIGLGIMGGPMASNLVKAGFRVVVHDLVPERVTALVAQGAEAGKTVSGTMKDVDLLITMLPDSPDLEAVVFSPGGVAENAREGLVFVDMSTVSPDTTRKVAKALGEKALAFGVYYNAGNRFSSKGDLKNCIRLSFAFYGEKDLARGIQRLSKIL